MSDPQYVLTWTYGDGSKAVYYRRGTNSWSTTFERHEATLFPSAKAALDTWLALHAFPDEYRDCISSGFVRAELFDQPEVLFMGAMAS